MKKAIIWGTGKTTYNFLRQQCFLINYEIIGFVDNNSRQWGKFYGDMDRKIYSPDEAISLTYDVIIICSIYFEEIQTQLFEMGITRKKIITYKDVEMEFVSFLCEKYKNSKDDEIQNVLSSYREKGFSIYGDYQAKNDTVYYIDRDSDGLPYTIFEKKRMYFRKNYQFIKRDGKECVLDIFSEQGEQSPHLYLKNKDWIKECSIVVDAGVCEGNFALRHIEKTKKMYLIEADSAWCEALEKTFKPYKNKVEIHNRFLTRFSSNKYVALDDIVKEKIDFLKMDIEGSEINAILGAMDTLKRSEAICAICSYHKMNDEKYIKYLLDTYGYNVSNSRGYMFFTYDNEIKDTMDFRRGIVYGEKRR